MSKIFEHFENRKFLDHSKELLKRKIMTLKFFMFEVGKGHFRSFEISKISEDFPIRKQLSNCRKTCFSKGFPIKLIIFPKGVLVAKRSPPSMFYSGIDRIWKGLQNGYFENLIFELRKFQAILEHSRTLCSKCLNGTIWSAERPYVLCFSIALW